MMENGAFDGAACDFHNLVHTEDSIQIYDNTRKITDLHKKFDEFYIEYEGFMYHIAYDVLKDSYLAEDAVQSAFINIYKSFEGVGNIKSAQTKHFVATVTRRAAINIYRQQQKQKEREPSFKDFERTPMPETGASSENSEVLNCIKRLPQKFADVLILRFVQGYKPREISKMLGCTQGAIRSRLFKGKALLRAELKKNGIHIKI